MRAFTDWANAQPTEARKKRLSPAYKGFFLPKRSSKGPYKSCPAEMPMKKLESESVILDTVVCKLVAMAGKAGRYISIDSGAMAVRSPIIRITLKLKFIFLSAIPAAVKHSLNNDAIICATAKLF
jgi:hypothetical protein